MRVATSLGVEVHLNDEKNEHGSHHDDTRHGRVLVREEIWQARVEEVAEGRREKLHVNQ